MPLTQPFLYGIYIVLWLQTAVCFHIIIGKGMIWFITCKFIKWNSFKKVTFNVYPFHESVIRFIKCFFPFHTKQNANQPFVYFSNRYKFHLQNALILHMWCVKKGKPASFGGRKINLCELPFSFQDILRIIENNRETPNLKLTSQVLPIRIIIWKHTTVYIYIYSYHKTM
jgi:hypothetical protein